MLASFVVGGLVALSLTVGGVAQAQSRCDAGVTKAAGKKVACKTKVIAQAQKGGVAADPAELAKCETKFDALCANAQSKGDCNAQTQACDDVEAEADACVGSLSGTVAGAQSSCDAGITKAGGAKVACKSRVIAQAQKAGVAADPAKLAKCETKFDASCAKAQSTGDCNAQTQACAAIEVTADACVDDLSRGTFTCVLVGQHCWFPGVEGTHCDATCAAQGLVYDPATATYAGSAGTDEKCHAVLNALYAFPFSTAENFIDAGIGCALGNGFFGPFGVRDINPTTSGAFRSGYSRACACM